MKYKELEQIFIEHEAAGPKYHLDGYIAFSSLGSFEAPGYTQLDRTYVVSSDNKAYKPNRLGYSIFGSCLNGHDPHVRLEQYMSLPNGWVPGECCLLLYQLQCVNERQILPPEIYPTLRQATEAMLRQLCEKGHLEYDEVLEHCDNHLGLIDESDFSADRNSAWLNAGSTGNWDWQIQPIRVYSLQSIAVGAPFFGEEDGK